MLRHVREHTDHALELREYIAIESFALEPAWPGGALALGSYDVRARLSSWSTNVILAAHALLLMCVVIHSRNKRQ